MKTQSITGVLVGLMVLLLNVQFPIRTSAQCTVAIQDDTIIACIGDTVMLQATGYCTSDTIFYDPFSSLTPGPAWSSNLPLMAPPCPPNQPTTGPYVVWFNAASGTWPRWTVLNNIDLATSSSPVYLSWDMKYGANMPTTTNCEAPDLPDEGVHIQYRIPPNTNWTDIQYYTPIGNSATGPLYTWNNYILNVPVIAYSASTSFRWYQDVTSGEDYDHWGIDNILIYDTASQSSYTTYTWKLNGFNAGTGQALPVIASTGAYYTVQLTKGLYTAYDTVLVLGLPAPTANLGNDTIIGLADSVVFDAGCQGCTYLWSTGATTPVVTIDTSTVGPGTHIIWVQVKRGMNCVSYDWTNVGFSPWAALGEAGRSRLSIYPNPGNGVLSVVIPDELHGHYRLEILDAGMRAIRTIEQDASDKELLNIDIGDIPSGMYYIRLISNEHCSTSPYIKY